VYYFIVSDSDKLALIDDVLAKLPNLSQVYCRLWEYVCKACIRSAERSGPTHQATTVPKLRRFLLTCDPKLAYLNDALGAYFADDEDVMCKCVIDHPESFKYASVSLKNSRSLVEKLLSTNAMVLQYAHAYCDDKELVLKAVSQCCRAFTYASQRLRADVEVIQHCIAQLKANSNTIEDAIVLKFAPAHIARQPNILQPALDASPWEILAVQGIVTQQELLRAVERAPNLFGHLWSNHRADYNLARAAISRNRNLLANACGALKSDPRILQLL
jgi:hypothetical protein